MDIFSSNKPPPEYDYSKPSQSTGIDLAFQENDLQQVLYSLHVEALQKTNENNYLEAICDLLHCEEILEAVTAKGELTDIDDVIVLLNNLAMCYQRIGEIDKALAYLDGCLFNFKQFSSKPSLKNDVKMNFSIAKIALQTCAMLSQKSSHKKALKHARMAQSLIESSIIGMAKTFNKALVKQKPDSRRSTSLSLKSKSLPSKSSASILRTLWKYVNSRVLTGTKQKYKYPEWLSEITISDIMLVQSISLSEFQEDFNLMEELSVDSLIYKVCLLATSHYCIATELHYIESINIIQVLDEATVPNEYHKALNLLSVFLPTESKLYRHIYEGFIKNCQITRAPSKEPKLKKYKPLIKRKCITPAPAEPTYKLPKTLRKSSGPGHEGKKSCHL